MKRTCYAYEIDPYVLIYLFRLFSAHKKQNEVHGSISYTKHILFIDFWL
jgi:hypothetical protein